MLLFRPSFLMSDVPTLERKIFLQLVQGRVGSIAHLALRDLLALFLFRHALSSWLEGMWVFFHTARLKKISFVCLRAKGYIFSFISSRSPGQVVSFILEELFHFFLVRVFRYAFSGGSRVRGQTQRRVSDLDQV